VRLSIWLSRADLQSWSVPPVTDWKVESVGLAVGSGDDFRPVGYTVGVGVGGTEVESQPGLRRLLGRADVYVLMITVNPPAPSGTRSHRADGTGPGWRRQPRDLWVRRGHELSSGATEELLTFAAPSRHRRRPALCSACPSGRRAGSPLRSRRAWAIAACFDRQRPRALLVQDDVCRVSLTSTEMVAAVISRLDL